MSFKAHDAFAVTDPRADVFQVSQRLHQVITPTFRRLRAELVARLVVKTIDAAGLEPQAARKDVMPLRTARRLWLDEQARMDPAARGHDPLGFNACIARTGDGRLLVKAFCQEEAYVDAMQADPLFTDHSYWDSTDPDQDVDCQPWESRRRDWEEVYHPDHALAHVPSWRLNQTLASTFSLPASDLGSTDPNTVVGARDRLQDAVRRRIWRMPELADQLEQDPIGFVMDACELARDLVAALEDEDPWMPPALPELTCTWDRVQVPAWPTAEQIIERVGHLGVPVPETLELPAAASARSHPGAAHHGHDRGESAGDPAGRDDPR